MDRNDHEHIHYYVMYSKIKEVRYMKLLLFYLHNKSNRRKCKLHYEFEWQVRE